jgi:hypothetical protein
MTTTFHSEAELGRDEPGNCPRLKEAHQSQLRSVLELRNKSLNVVSVKLTKNWERGG